MPTRKQQATAKQNEELFEEAVNEEATLPDITFAQLRDTLEKTRQQVADMAHVLETLVPENTYAAITCTTTVQDEEGYTFTLSFADTAYQQVKASLKKNGLKPASFFREIDSGDAVKKSRATTSRANRQVEEPDDLWECPDHGLDWVADSRFGGYYCQHKDRNGNFCKRNSKKD